MKRRVGMDEGVKWFLLDPLHVTARRVCCARGRFLAMGVARMRPWPRLVRGALRYAA